MTCRIRAGEVARPHECGFTPRAARSGTSHGGDRSGDPSCSGPPLLPIHFPRDRSSGRRQDSASARTAPPLRRGLVVSHGSCLAGTRNPNGTWLLCCYSPLTRSGGRPCVRSTVVGGDDAGTSGAARTTAAGGGVPRNLDRPRTGRVPTPKGGTSFGPFRNRPTQLSERGGRVSRPVRRSPSSTRRARARVDACSSVSPRACISSSASRSAAALATSAWAARSPR